MPSFEPHTIDMGASMETEEALEIIDALNEVSDVLAMVEAEVTFLGKRQATLDAGDQLTGVDVYACPRGWFLLLREPSGPHRAVAGESLTAALGDVEEEDLRHSITADLQREGLLS